MYPSHKGLGHTPRGKKRKSTVIAESSDEVESASKSTTSTELGPDEYEVEEILGYKHKDPRKTELLDDNILVDPDITFRTKWAGYPNTDYNDFGCFKGMPSEGSVMERLAINFFELVDTRDDKGMSGEDYDKLWYSFKDTYGEQASHFSSLTDFYPMAAQYTDRTNEYCKVRVHSLNKDFYNKVKKGDTIKARYRITWEDAQMFTKCKASHFKKKYPDMRIFKAPRNAESD